jgi:hypothetical protein
MARDLFIDLTNNRLAASETNLAPAGSVRFTKGDNGAFNLYFLQATGVINQPFTVVDKSASSIKFGIGSRLATPETGTYSLTFGGDTTTGLDAAVTAGQIQSALNGLSAISSAGGVTVTGELADHFTVRFATAGTRGSITADVSQLIPDTVAVIDERIAGSASVKEIQEIQLRLTPAVYQATWTDLSTTVTATVATTVTGSSLNNEVQRLSFSQEPFVGNYRLTFPSMDLEFIAGGVVEAVTSGIFSTISNHGLILNQPIQIFCGDGVTGFESESFYFVKTIPQSTQFGLAVTAGGTLIATSAAATSFAFATIARQTAPISATASAADIQSALQSLDSIGAGGIIATGIPGEYFDLTFSGPKGYVPYSLNDLGGEITIDHNLSAKPGKTADVNFATFALRDLIGNNSTVDLDLEIELTEAGTRQTVILSGCTVAEELIDTAAFSPTSGYPSFIFQALTTAATNATTSLVAITGLNWTAQANSEYLVEWGPLIENNEADLIIGQVSVPTGSSMYGKWIRSNLENGYLSPSLFNLTVEDEIFLGLGVTQVLAKGYLKTGSSSGPVSFKFANNGAVTSATIVQTGSWVRVEKVK